VEGLLVPPRDPSAVARAAQTILEDPDLAARFSAAGRKRAATFDWRVVGARLEALYRQAVLTGPLR
jgi:glycosyltransferase involved in cell wall biosynthesis